MSAPSTGTVAPHQHFDYPEQFASPFAPANGTSRPVDLAHVEILGGYWAELQEKNHTDMIAHCEYWLERLGWISNFDHAAAGTIVGNREGREFSDSETYKLMEAMAWEIGRTGDEALNARFESLVDRVLPVQEPDGYLSTMFGREGQAPRYSDLEWGHELYCYGHLIQAGVARGRTVGHDRFVEMVVRVADHVCEVFGPDGIDNVCGHPEIETALAELARLTGDEKYREQAELFIERRGHGRLKQIDFGQQYFQDDIPVRERKVMAGHAVRENYLLSGVVDVAVDGGDDELLRTAITTTRNTIAKRTYITGGQGSHHEGESFGQDFELPPDRAYSETCAGISSVQLNQRLLLATGSAEHAEVVERTLFNVVSAGIAADGKAFFYTNTLHQRDPGHVVPQDEPAFRATNSQRAPWYAVSCCPTNLTRTIASVGAYLASTSGDTLLLHQYADSRISPMLTNGSAVVRVSTSYPLDGLVAVEVEDLQISDDSAGFSLSLRVPAWAAGATVSVDGGSTMAAEVGYVNLSGLGKGSRVELMLPMAPRWTRADYRVDAVRGQVAVERGPLVYAMESVDLGESVNTVAVDTTSAPEFDGEDVVVNATSVAVSDEPWPFGGGSTTLSRSGEARPVRLIPYAHWGNRGPSTMRVWLPEQR